MKTIYSAIWITALEIGALALLAGGLYATVKAVLSELVERKHALTAWGTSVRRRTRNVLATAAVMLSAGAVAFNSWLAVQGINAAAHTWSIVRAIDASTWIAFGIAVVKLLLGVIAVATATRLIGPLLRSGEAAINRWDRVSSNNQSLRAFFGGLERVIANCSWMVLAVLTCRWFGLPVSISTALFLILRIYLVIVIGLLLVRSTSVSAWNTHCGSATCSIGRRPACRARRSYLSSVRRCESAGEPCSRDVKAAASARERLPALHATTYCKSVGILLE